MRHSDVLKQAAFMPPKNLAEVLTALEWVPCVPVDRRAQMMSSVRCVCRLMGSDPSAVPAAPAQLRKRFDDLRWQTTGRSQSYVRNIKGHTLAAMRATGVDVMASRSRLPLSAKWQTLRDVIDDRAIWCPLSRLAAYCTDADIQPAAVDEAVLTQFEAALRLRSIKSDPSGSAGRMRKAWRKASLLVEGAATYEVPAPKKLRRYSLNWDEFPASFVADVEAFTSARTTPNPFAVNYSCAVAASTASARRNQIRQLASALVKSGFPVEDLTSLAVLTKLENAEAALDYLWRQAGSKKTKFQGQQATLLKTISHHWTGAPTEAVARLSHLASRVGIQKRGMVAKNRERLRQFDVESNIFLLLGLPGKVFRELAKRKVLSPGDATRGLYALATQILLRSPIRCTNLCHLELGTQIQTVRSGGSEAKRLVLEKTKNGDPYEVVLPADTVQLLSQYLATIRPTLTSVHSNWLFPSSQGTRRNAIAFGRGLEAFVEQQTGLLMNPHCFRHFSVLLRRRLKPGDSETSRQLLGHRSDDAIQAYAMMDSAEAAKRYDEMIAKLMAERPLFTPPNKPRRK